MRFLRDNVYPDVEKQFFVLAQAAGKTRDAAITFANDRSVYKGFRELLKRLKFSTRVITTIMGNEHTFAYSKTLEYLARQDEEDAFALVRIFDRLDVVVEQSSNMHMVRKHLDSNTFLKSLLVHTEHARLNLGAEDLIERLQEM